MNDIESKPLNTGEQLIQNEQPRNVDGIKALLGIANLKFSSCRARSLETRSFGARDIIHTDAAARAVVELDLHDGVASLQYRD